MVRHELQMYLELDEDVLVTVVSGLPMYRLKAVTFV